MRSMPTIRKAVRRMKNKLLFVLGAVASLVSCSLAVYKLLYPYPRYVGLYGCGSFRELYDDNAEVLKGADIYE